MDQNLGNIYTDRPKSDVLSGSLCEHDWIRITRA